MTLLMSSSKFWVAFDSGLTPVSRGHLEDTILNHASKLELQLDWLVSHQLTRGARRIAFTAAASDRSKLDQLLADFNNHFPSFAGEAELDELIDSSISQSSGRAVLFPLEANISTIISVNELIATSAIDSVIAIGEECPVDAQLSINDYARPTFNDGKLELLVERIAGGFFAPIERQSPHECCGGHGQEAPIAL